MARFVVHDRDLIVRLTAIERFAALRRSPIVPLAAVRSVEVVNRPWRRFLLLEVRMGFAAGGAPGRTIVTAGPRARTADGGEAVVFVYLNHPSVVVRTSPDFEGPRLLVVSSRTAEADAASLRAAAGI